MTLWEQIGIYFKPTHVKPSNHPLHVKTIGGQMRVADEEGDVNLDGVQVALIGVKEDRRQPENTGCAHAPDPVREELYKLYMPNLAGKIADLGNIDPGDKPEDTYYALQEVVGKLLRASVLPVVVGGSNDLTYPLFAAYEAIESTINLVSIDSGFDLGEFREETHAGNYLGKIVMHEPNFLFNFSNIGYQTYLVDPDFKSLMDKMYFDVYRLGEVNGKLEEMEPIMRNADLVSVDIASVRASDAPGQLSPHPNGFYGEDVCQLCYYAGMSDKLTAIGFFECNPMYDTNRQTAKLVSQMIWCVLDGMQKRVSDFPFIDKSYYQKFRVAVKDVNEEIIFYKSLKSDRWWMDVPYPPDKSVRYQRHHLVPCSYSDYQSASNDELPEKWWQTYRKLV